VWRQTIRVTFVVTPWLLTRRKLHDFRKKVSGDLTKIKSGGKSSREGIRKASDTDVGPAFFVGLLYAELLQQVADVLHGRLVGAGAPRLHDLPETAIEKAGDQWLSEESRSNKRPYIRAYDNVISTKMVCVNR